MIKRALTVILAFLIIFSIAPTAFAEADTTPPVLVSCIPTKTNYSSGEDVEFILKVTDDNDLEPYDCDVDIVNTDKSYFFRIRLGFKSDISAEQEKEQGIYTFICSAPVNDIFATGHYEINAIWLGDNVGNKEYLINGQFTQCEIYVENTARTDFTGPALISAETDKKNVSVGDTITFTIRASDPAGIGNGYISLCYGPDYTPFYQTIPLSQVGDDNSLWRGSFKISPYMKQDTYQFSANMNDTFGNDGGGWNPQCNFYVSNPDYNPGKPIVEKIELSKDHIKPGDKVTIKVKINPNGSALKDFTGVYLPDSYITIYHADLKYDEAVLYTGEWTVPAYSQSRKCSISVSIWGKDNVNTKYYGECGNYKFPDLYLVSVFSGLENRSVLAGSSFDPMEGVSASNDSQGDMTDKIEIIGSVNTGQPGLYLLHYKIKSDQNINYNGIMTPIYYLESRWIGVTEVMPDTSDSDAALSLTNDSLMIGAESSDVSIKRDGQSVSYSGTYTVPGVYSVSENGAVQQSAAMSLSSLNTAQALSVSDSLKSTVTAVLDRSGPVVKASWQRDPSGAFTVTVNAGDVSGVAEMKYMAGECDLGECKDGGTVFTKTFPAPAYGKYTIYSRDKLDNESVTVITVTSVFPSAYLYGIDLTAGSLSRAFSKTCYSYKINLSEHQDSVTLTPIKDFDGASMTIAGKSVSSYTISLANGRSVNVYVKVKYGRTTKTYKFTVTRAKSTNNDLTSLAAAANGVNVPFNEAFSPDNLSYSLTLDEFTKSVKITDTAAPYAKSSFKSRTFSLKNGGMKVICLTVTAQSGARKTYTITVTRDKSTNNTLKSLKTSSHSFALSPAFSPDVSEYTVTMPVNKSTFTLYASPAGYKASVMIDGIKRTSKKITLQAGQSTEVQVKVTAQSGAEKVYDITVSREISNDTRLKSLKTSSGSCVLSPAFNPDVTEYTIATPASKSTFTLYASSSGYGSSVTIDGSKRTSKKITLQAGQSAAVRVVVTAQSGDTREYVISVTRS